MKPRKISLCLLALAMTMAMSTSAFAASPDEPLLSGTEPEVPEICYPTYVAQSDDGTELRKYYDLGPEDDPAGIPRSDFEQDGFHYTMTDLLKQELPEYEERLHTETVSVASKSKDMATVLSVLPEKKEKGAYPKKRTSVIRKLREKQIAIARRAGKPIPKFLEQQVEREKSRR